MNTPQTDTPDTNEEAALMTLDCDDSCVEIYIKRHGMVMDGDFVLGDFARTLERRAIATEARVKELEAAIEFKETCQTCNALCDPADVEAGDCIWCIAKQFKRERDEARASLRLRPIAEAGPVPDGAVRLVGFIDPTNHWTMDERFSAKDTHFIDIYPPQQ